MTKIAERIKELRIERKLTEEELGKQIGVSATAISRWENKVRVPSVDSLYLLALFFKVSADYLLGISDF